MIDGALRFRVVQLHDFSAAAECTGCRSLRPLLHMELLLEGVSVCGRSDMFLSLPMNETHLAKAHDALEKFIDQHKSLIEEVLQA